MPNSGWNASKDSSVGVLLRSEVHGKEEMVFIRVTFGAGLKPVPVAWRSSTVSESVGTITTQMATTTTTLDTGVQALDPIGRILPGQRLSVGDYTTTVMTPTSRFSTSEFWDFLGEFP
jgi:hypothetical protein